MAVQQNGGSAVEQVFEYLKAAQSPQPEVQKAAEAALKSLESQSGFCSCLAEVIRNKQADHSARWLGSILFKNTVVRFWKARPGQQGISEEEKQHLRVVLLQLFDQENSQIAVPIAVAVARVARIDYPKHWPLLFQDLLGSMDTQDTLRVRRVYLVLHHIIKELASMKLPADKQNFSQVAGLLFQHYWKQWCGDTQLILQGLCESLASPQANNPLVMVFERWFLEIKGIWRMVVFGQKGDVTTLQPSAVVTEVVPVLLEALCALHAMRPPQSATRTHLLAMLERGLIKLTKTLTRIQEVNPWSFYHCTSFGPCLSFFAGVLTSQQPQARSQSYDRFLMQAMVLLHQVLSCRAYKGIPESLSLGSDPEQHAKKVKAMGEAAGKELTAFWCAGSGQSLCRALIQLYLPLSAKELQEWEESAEEFHQQSGGGAWEDSLRGCAEALLITLLGLYRKTLAPVVLDILQASSAGCPPGSASSLPGPRLRAVPEAALAKEAAYNAAGVTSWDLFDSVDFNNWLQSGLLPDMQDKSPENKPVRRRAALVVGQWVSKLGAQERPSMYRALLGLMAEDDFAIALAGVTALHELVSDWDFTEQQFLEFVGPCLEQLAAILHAAAQYETQIQVFNLINLIFDRLADSMRPFVGTVIRLLPDLWREAEDQSLLRIQMLLALQRIMNALGPESPSTYPMVLPILQVSTDPHAKDELNLLEDGLQLWAVTLRNAPQPHPGVVALFPHLVAVLQKSTEHMRSAACIMLSLVLLGGRDFLMAHGQSLTGILNSLIGKLTERGMLLLLPVMCVVIQIIPEEGPQLLEGPLRVLLSHILSGNESSYVVAGQAQFVMLTIDTPARVIKPASFGAYARVLLHNHAFFPRLFAPHPQFPQSGLLAPFVEAWLDRFDSIQGRSARKLSALGLCMLLRVSDSGILRHLHSIVAHLTAVWFELEEEGSEWQEELSFHDWYGPFEISDTGSSALASSDEAAGEYSRKFALHERDPVNLVKLSDFVKEQFEAAAVAHGSHVFNEAVNQLDPALKGQLAGLLTKRKPA